MHVCMYVCMYVYEYIERERYEEWKHFSGNSQLAKALCAKTGAFLGPNGDRSRHTLRHCL